MELRPIFKINRKSPVTNWTPDQNIKGGDMVSQKQKKVNIFEIEIAAKTVKMEIDQGGLKNSPVWRAMWLGHFYLPASGPCNPLPNNKPLNT